MDAARPALQGLTTRLTGLQVKRLEIALVLRVGIGVKPTLTHLPINRLYAFHVMYDARGKLNILLSGIP